MTAPAWYNDGKILKVGEVYPFNFIKLVMLADGEQYMIMEDIFEMRHMVMYCHFLKYNLTPGQKVNCRVDKVNCTGRVILEPEHPVYKIGSVAEFAVLRIESGKSPESLDKVIVSDIFGNEIHFETKTSELNLSDNKIDCLIEGLKKGKPILRFAKTI
ncbi:MAG: hypothetical protein CVU14_10810 [Bacteroidetes bacterium HGW-Bacteroidetes-9]|nr:MAG: hypothetical protein CVU14_10810 [Bacteroidetes bacterium HGW-Bacteroidetes-9]